MVSWDRWLVAFSLAVMVLDGLLTFVLAPAVLHTAHLSAALVYESGGDSIETFPGPTTYKRIIEDHKTGVYTDRDGNTFMEFETIAYLQPGNSMYFEQTSSVRFDPQTLRILGSEALVTPPQHLEKADFLAKMFSYVPDGGTAFRFAGVDRVLGLETYVFEYALTDLDWTENYKFDLPPGVKITATDSGKVWIEPVSGVMVNHKERWAATATGGGHDGLAVDIGGMWMTNDAVARQVFRAQDIKRACVLYETVLPLAMLGIAAAFAAAAVERTEGRATSRMRVGVLLAFFTTAVTLISVIGWYALDFSSAVGTLLDTPTEVPATMVGLWVVALAAVAVLVASIVAYYVNPLAELRTAARKVASGNYDVRVTTSGGRELSEYQDAFNQMVGGLSARAHAEKRFRTVFEHANIGIAQGGLDGRLVAVNDTFARLLGYGRDELLGMSWTDFTDPEDKARQLPEHEAMVAGRQDAYSLEKRYVRKDGAVVWADVSLATVRGGDGRPEYIIATAQDITDWKKAEDGRRRAIEDLQFFRQVLDRSKDAVEIIDFPSGRFIDVSQAACDQLGYSRDELLAMRVSDIDPARPEDTWEPWGPSGGEQPLQVTSVHRRKDGSTFPVDVGISLVEMGGRRLCVTVVRDATERELAAETLRLQEEKLRLVLEATEEGVYAVGLDGVCTLCNPAAVRMLGYDRPDDIVGRDVHALIHHSHPDGTPYPREDCRAFNAFRTSRIIRVDDEVFWRRDGSPFRVEYAAHPMVRGTSVVGAVVSFSDITGRIATENALRHAQKMDALGSLAGGLAHEVNNMLLPILSLTNLTLRDVPTDSRAHARLARIAEAAGRAKDIVAQVMTFARRQQEVHHEAVDMVEAVKEALGLVQPLVPASVTIEADLATGCGAVTADREAIGTILVNLASNAIDAMEGRPGRLGVALGRIGHDEALALRVPGLQPRPYLRLAVSDSGCGMEAETVQRMFDPFFTTKGVGRGSGLGLAVVHGLVAAMDGAIAVSSAVDKGTTIEVFLPAA